MRLTGAESPVLPKCGCCSTLSAPPANHRDHGWSRCMAACITGCSGRPRRLFWTYRGGIYQPSTLWQVLQKARVAAFGPALVASPLARKPYDSRHAGVSWRLNAGTPGPQVAEWAGHSVEVLYRIYAHCIDGDDDRWYKRMEEFLG
jgi:hypothetical protein